MGRPFDGRVDQYSLAMTVHEVLCGRQLHGRPDAFGDGGQPDDGRPAGPDRTDTGYPGSTVRPRCLRGLSKDPAGRFPNCVAMAQEILAAVPSGESAETATTPIATHVARRPRPRALSVLPGPDAGGTRACRWSRPLPEMSGHVAGQPPVVEHGPTETRRSADPRPRNILPDRIERPGRRARARSVGRHGPRRKAPGRASRRFECPGLAACPLGRPGGGWPAGASRRRDRPPARRDGRPTYRLPVRGASPARIDLPCRSPSPTTSRSMSLTARRSSNGWRRPPRHSRRRRQGRDLGQTPRHGLDGGCSGRPGGT